MRMKRPLISLAGLALLLALVAGMAGAGSTIASSLFSARLCEYPAEMATIPDSPAGTAAAPQPTTVPSLRSARLWFPPAAMAFLRLSCARS